MAADLVLHCLLMCHKKTLGLYVLQFDLNSGRNRDFSSYLEIYYKPLGVIKLRVLKYDIITKHTKNVQYSSDAVL